MATQRDVAPPVIMPVTLNRCQEVVIVTAVGPTSHVVHPLSRMPSETVIVPDGTLSRNLTLFRSLEPIRDLRLNVPKGSGLLPTKLSRKPTVPCMSTGER